MYSIGVAFWNITKKLLKIIQLDKLYSNNQYSQRM